MATKARPDALSMGDLPSDDLLAMISNDSPPFSDAASSSPSSLWSFGNGANGGGLPLPAASLPFGNGANGAHAAAL